MTIHQLIDQLSDIGQEIGITSEVKLWFIGDASKLEPLAVLQPVQVTQGIKHGTSTRLAVIQIQP